MKQLAHILTKIIDFFYRPFARWMPKQVFRYAVCGGGNLVLDWVLYFLVYNFVIGHENVILSFCSFEQVITPHIASLCIVFPITLLTGFWLQRNITFNVRRTDVRYTKESKALRWRQLGRYMLVVAINLAVNYFGLKLCVESFGWYPTPSKMAITVVTVIISYLCQKHYTFKEGTPRPPL